MAGLSLFLQYGAVKTAPIIAVLTRTRAYSVTVFWSFSGHLRQPSGGLFDDQAAGRTSGASSEKLVTSFVLSAGRRFPSWPAAIAPCGLWGAPEVIGNDELVVAFNTYARQFNEKFTGAIADGLSPRCRNRRPSSSRRPPVHKSGFNALPGSVIPIFMPNR